jgi:hypothetical protein
MGCRPPLTAKVQMRDWDDRYWVGRWVLRVGAKLDGAALQAKDPGYKMYA